MQKNALKRLKGKKIAILGLGIENQAMLKFLLNAGLRTEITICDARTPEMLGGRFTRLARRKNIRWQLGSVFNKELYKFDILFRSPGWPISCPGIQEALKRKFPPTPLRKGGEKNIAPLIKGGAGGFLNSPMKLFFDLCPTKNVIGVTGTKGKGTTSSLIADILRAGKKKTWLGGNIGIAPFDLLPKVKKSDWVILELSSFQLEDMTASPHIAVITNFYPEHLAPADPHNPNYHKSLKSYREAKLNIVRWQKQGDYAIVNSKFQIPNSKSNFKSKIIKFYKSCLESGLIGEHNKENIAAAVEVSKLAGIKDKTIADAVAKFKGLEHRLEFTGDIKGVKFYNDSFATTPEATITALKSFQQPIVLLVGGADKGANFKKLAREMKKRARFAVLLDGAATKRIKKELDNAGYPAEQMKTVYNIKEAVATARQKAELGDVVLLSTACASFGMFNNYKERGKLFKEEIKKQSHS